MRKKWLIALLGMLAATLIGAVLYLLPAHMQVRDVRPSLPDASALRALTESDNKPVRVSAVLTSSQRSLRGSIGHHAVVVEWADGRLFLIDAGMDAENAAEFGRLMELLWSSDPAEFHTTVFDALGERSSQVAAVGFTHLHIDHVQGIELACASEPPFVVVQSRHQRELQNMNTEESATILESCPRGEPIDAGNLTEVPGFPGLAIYALGGHTPGSTLFAVAVDDQVLLFPGDITNAKSDLIHDRDKGFVYSFLLVPEDTARTRDLRSWLRDMQDQADIHVYVSHDLADMRELNRRF